MSLEQGVWLFGAAIAAEDNEFIEHCQQKAADLEGGSVEPTEQDMEAMAEMARQGHRLVSVISAGLPPAQKKPIPLFRLDEAAALRSESDVYKVVAFACGDCGHIAGSVKNHGSEEDAKRAAERHCHYICDTCSKDCGKTCYCSECSLASRRKLNQKHFDEAKKVTLTEYAREYLYVPDLGDEYFRDFDRLWEHCLDSDIDLPDVIFGCKPNAFYLDADRMIENELEEHYEDAGENITPESRAKLDAFLTAWSEEQGIETQEPDYETGIVLSDKDRADFRKERGVDEDGDPE